MQILGQKAQLSIHKNPFFSNEAARYPRGNRAACSLGPRSRSPPSVRILHLRHGPALIRINGGAVAKKHQCHWKALMFPFRHCGARIYFLS